MFFPLGDRGIYPFLKFCAPKSKASLKKQLTLQPSAVKIHFQTRTKCKLAQCFLSETNKNELQDRCKLPPFISKEKALSARSFNCLLDAQNSSHFSTFSQLTKSSILTPISQPPHSPDKTKKHACIKNLYGCCHYCKLYSGFQASYNI